MLDALISPGRYQLRPQLGGRLRTRDFARGQVSHRGRAGGGGAVGGGFTPEQQQVIYRAAGVRRLGNTRALPASRKVVHVLKQALDGKRARNVSWPADHVWTGPSDGVSAAGVAAGRGVPILAGAHFIRTAGRREYRRAAALCRRNNRHHRFRRRMVDVIRRASRNNGAAADGGRRPGPLDRVCFT